MGLFDPVWGGFYRYSMTADWSQPHYEKLLYTQSGAIDNYLHAYQVTGLDKYGETAAGVKKYLQRFMTEDERGGFFASQDADMGAHDSSVRMVPGEEYYPKNEEERLKIGIPYVDRTIYTDWNGMMISSYLRLFQVLGDHHALEFALKTLDRLLSENLCDGQMCHYVEDGPQLGGMLSDQVYFAQALVDAYQSTGIRRYLNEAEKLTQFMETELQDVMDGGFYFRTFDPHAKFEPFERHKPFDENVSVVSLLESLGYLTGNDAYRQLAERTLRAISYRQASESIVGMGFGVAVDNLVSPPVHIVLVGDKTDERTQAMLESSLHAYGRQKLVQVLDPKDGSLQVGNTAYQAGDEPLAYVCVDKSCRPPVKSLEELNALLRDVMAC
jgi:uncharacterized protein